MFFKNHFRNAVETDKIPTNTNVGNNKFDIIFNFFSKK